MIPKKTHKRTRAQKENDLSFIAELATQSLTIEQIVKNINKKNEGKYTLATSVVYSDYLKVLEKWREERTALIDTLMDVDLQKLSFIEREVIAAWKKSKASNNGDPKYLSILLNCIDKRQQLLGYGKTINDVTNNIQINIQSAQVQMSQDEIKKEMARIQENIRRQIRNENTREQKGLADNRAT